MDNLPCHKVAGVQEAIGSRGAQLLYLPPYSPDLNPIEQAFAKLKALLRKTAERTVDGLWRTIGRLLDHFPPAECANYLVNSGYCLVAERCWVQVHWAVEEHPRRFARLERVSQAGGVA